MFQLTYNGGIPLSTPWERFYPEFFEDLVLSGGSSE